MSTHPLEPILQDTASQFLSRHPELEFKREVKVDPKGNFNYHLKRDRHILWIGRQALRDDDLVYILEHAIERCCEYDEPEPEPCDFYVSVRIVVTATTLDEAERVARDCMRVSHPKVRYWEVEGEED